MNCLPDAENTIINRQSLVDLKKALISEVSDVLAAVAGEIKEVNNRLDVLEGNTATPDTPSFARILKQTLDESKYPGKNTTEVVEGGRKRTVKDQQVLVVKPKATDSENTNPPDKSAIETALASVPVDKCTTTGKGALVVKLPTKEAKDEASNALNQCLGPDSTFRVSEPKKMLPKITLVGITQLTQDEEIIPSILNKNPQIKNLVDDGCTFKLLFTKKTGTYSKSAIIKLSPEIRSAILDCDSAVYVGLVRCRAYDRFWVTQCYHCQRFGHTVDKCPVKDQDPKCSFCAGSHRSKDCTNKASPKCVNCASSSSVSGPSNHYSSSRDCPLMKIQRNIIIENTNFTCSKN